MTKVTCVMERKHCNLSRRVCRKQDGTTHIANKPAATIAKTLMASHTWFCGKIQQSTLLIYFILSFVLYVRTAVRTALYRHHFKATRIFQEVEKRHCATYSGIMGQEPIRQPSKKWL